jgi:hypothetical protein
MHCLQLRPGGRLGLACCDKTGFKGLEPGYSAMNESKLLLTSPVVDTSNCDFLTRLAFADLSHQKQDSGLRGLITLPTAGGLIDATNPVWAG